MAELTRISSEKWWSRKATRRWTAFRDTPWKRLRLFLVAAFLLFSVVGFFNDLMNGAQTPYAVVALIAFVSGMDSVAWVLATARSSRWVLGVLLALQFLIGPVLSRLANWMVTAFSLQPAAPETGMRVAAIGILLATVGSYCCFVWFFRVEGRESARIRRELELAHGIQATLVPPLNLRTARWEIHGISQPSEKVGGDLVDVVRLEGGGTVAYVADIAGHGLPAGILMGMLKTAARTALLESAAAETPSTLPLLMEKLNRVLPQVKEPQMYATLTAFRLGDDGSVWYAMAASPPILHWSAGGSQRLEESQYPLGLLPVSGFHGNRMCVAQGDLLVVATDGILEVCDAQGDEYGAEGVERVVGQQGQQPLEALAAAILKDVRAFGPQIDDQTLLLIRRVA